MERELETMNIPMALPSLRLPWCRLGLAVTNALALINVVALRRARLVLGWVIVRTIQSWYLS